MPSQRALLPRSTPAAAGISSRAIDSLLDQLEARSVECHSIMVVRRGHVVAEGWWAPYSAERPHLLYSLTKSFASVAVGLAIADGLLTLDDRLVDVLPEHVPADISEQGRRITVHHLLSMTAGHSTDSLDEAWRLEPDDLVKGFLRVPMTEAEGTRHTYDNATTFILARMVERVTGRGLPELLDERLFLPMGIDHAEWDRVASGAAFGFHGLHLTTEAVAAFGELLLRGGGWGDRQLIARDWVELATRRHSETLPLPNWSQNPDFLCGYGYQFWMSRHGYHGHGAFGQYCVVVPSHELVVVVTGAVEQEDVLPGLFWDCLLPGRPGAFRQGETRRLGRGFGSARRNHGDRRSGGRWVAPAIRVVPHCRGRPRRMAGKFATRPPCRRDWRLAGQHVHRRAVRHHLAAPGPAGGRRRRGDSDGDLERRTTNQPQSRVAPPITPDDPARRRVDEPRLTGL
ncbi:beta-lactamase family protein [Kribbella sp. NBC_01245]|uniref:serine hydrolase domain-containing protein n=1 Tax=Kribbella sp. NBC_01245 TaxID=2903578 RepID=UPI002E2D9CA1|nr:serine hydrolase domain-containing protein [Kribbella sp. NBC_01245]